MLEFIRNKRICIFGFGAQGSAHALDLRDSGMNVTVCLPENSKTIKEVKRHGLPVTTDPMLAAGHADIVAFMVPDGVAPALYKDIEGSLKKGATILFAHGFNIHFGKILPRKDIDVVLVAPLAHGDEVRRRFLAKETFPVVTAVETDFSGNAWKTAEEYSLAIGSTKQSIIRSTFKEETETDLFSEQALICGGLYKLITSAFETLVENGYSPEIAYHCCLQETAIMAEMFAKHGISGTLGKISDVARFGTLKAGPFIIDNGVRSRMNEILREIKDGTFICKFDERENDCNILNDIKDHTIEDIHEKWR